MTTTKQLYANNAKSTAANTISSSDTSIVVADGSQFPTCSPGEYFLVTLEYGGVIEVVKVQSKSGNSLNGCLRGQEGTTAQGFPIGARVENRITKGTLDTFARKIDKVDELTSVDLLDPPLESNSNSYLCYSNDDSGNPAVALKGQGSTWKFLTHSTAVLTGTIDTVNSFGLTSSEIEDNVTTLVPGKYIVQFVTGVNIGLCRAVTSTSTDTISWGTPLAVIPSAGDQFEIYKSDTSSLKELLADLASPYSDPLKANLAGPTNFTGVTTFENVTFQNQSDSKVSLTASTSTTAINVSTASVIKLTIAANTALTFTNAPAGTNVFSFTLITVNDATAGRAISFPAGSKYAGGIVPPRTTAANAVDVWSIFTEDAGTTWNISLAINDLKS